MEVSHLDHLQADFLPSLLGIRAETQLLSWLRRSRAHVCMCRRRSQRWPPAAEARQAERREPDCFTRSSSNPPRRSQLPPPRPPMRAPPPPRPDGGVQESRSRCGSKERKNKSEILIVSPPNGRANKQGRQTRRVYRGADLRAARWSSDKQEEEVC